VVEFHVDSCSTFEETLNSTTRFGAKNKTRMDRKTKRYPAGTVGERLY
jgi:hypothetical protein